MELMVVIVIIGILSTTAFVGFSGMSRKLKLEAAATMIRDKAQYARTKTISTSRKHAVVIKKVKIRNSASAEGFIYMWKLETIDSVDNVFDNDNDRIIDIKPYYFDLGIELNDSVRMEFNQSGGVSYVNINPIILSDKTETVTWQIKLMVYRGSGIIKMFPIEKLSSVENNVENKGSDTKQKSEEDMLKEFIGID